jgi:hypothetical protein
MQEFALYHLQSRGITLVAAARMTNSAARIKHKANPQKAKHSVGVFVNPSNACFVEK